MDQVGAAQQRESRKQSPECRGQKVHAMQLPAVYADAGRHSPTHLATR